MPRSGFLQILESVDSTNNYAMGQVHAGLASHGMGWFALEQTAGKGQRGKNWKTSKGENITMSVVLEPELFGTVKPFLLSVAVALACYDLFKKYAGEDTRIKWPNDLYWRDRKAGGILIENVYHGKTWKWAVAGTGININQTTFDPALPNPVSLKQVTGRNFDVAGLANELLDRILGNISSIIEGGSQELLKRYNEGLFKRGETVLLVENGREIRTTIRAVSEDGFLITSDTVDRRFDFGSVEWVL